MKLTVVGCSPAWPNPGGAQSGYLVEAPGTGRFLLDCGPGVLARLRLHDDWPLVDAIAITHFHLDHWGDLVPWVWGALAGPGRHAREARAARTARRARAARRPRSQARRGEDMFEQVFRIREFATGVPTEVAGFELPPAPGTPLPARGVRVPRRATGTPRVLRRLGAERRARRARARLRPLRLRGDAARRASPIFAGISLPEAEEAFEASGAHRLLVTHRPKERPTDGLTSSRTRGSRSSSRARVSAAAAAAARSVVGARLRAEVAAVVVGGERRSSCCRRSAPGL